MAKSKAGTSVMAARRYSHLRRPLGLPRRVALLAPVMARRFQLPRVALDSKDDGPLFPTVGRGGHRGDDLTAVGQLEAHREGAIAAERDRLALEGDAGVGLGRAVDDQFGVDLEDERAVLAAGQKARAEACD